MTVAILCPTHNRADTLPEMIESCLRQTDADWRLYLLDDGSTDDTSEVWTRHRWFNDGRMGIIYGPKAAANEPAVRNRLLRWWLPDLDGCTLACWLDSDDVMHPDRIKVQREYMEAHPTVDISFTALGWFTDANVDAARRGDFLEPFFKPEPSMYGKSLETYRGNLTTPTAMFRPSVRRVPFDEQMIHGGCDLLWLFTLANSGFKIGAVDRQLYYLRQHPGRLTNVRKKMTAEQVKPDLDHFYAEIERMGGTR